MEYKCQLRQSVKMVYMFEISTTSVTRVQRLLGGGAYLIFGPTDTAFTRDWRLIEYVWY